MISLLLFTLLISTPIYGMCLWLTHTRLHWRYVGLLQIALSGCYLIIVFYAAGLAQSHAP
ncbi:hypothetical protein [Candidatus Contendibacter odensensis]|uniref:Uncharacterized protein n=1 Tax=Candidatus Contendobacter odensis Run_B_J11 TaxID=1400861 RepID=A0A7U7J4F8_9GAMM|nr:hypothetical protein [Candidatus Contendobacter odensis]MBK8755251.1 hypothetical protein [Candidatus Competibacteraceae bacterium]CDH45575.1 hypothetical protein BN874_2610003 [Candidatus Contendobacter odensis Run_B_J11]